MLEWIQTLQEQIGTLSPGRRMALGATALGSLAFFGWISLGLSQPDERLLYRGLGEEEALDVVEALDNERIAYRLADGGSSVYVDAAQVHEARIRVSGRGLPAGGGGGFEIFDDVGFGVTDYVNRVNYQRALQGELARSIEQLDGVEAARIQVATPRRQGFVSSRAEQPSASVVIRMRPGHELDEAQVRGVVHLVASSVEGLDATKVTVVDERGRLLAPESDAGGASDAMRHEAKLEAALAQRIESILEPTVGVGRVVARVRADLEWTQVERTEERFDPDSQIARSEEISTETTMDSTGAAGGGVPGAASNLPGGAGLAATGGTESSRKTETTNYEINKIVSRTVGSTGGITRLDVAVLVDGKPAENAEGGFVPWEPGSLQSFEDLAKRAVGFSEERGDQITITTAPFRTIEIEEPGGLPAEWLLLATTLLRVLGIVTAVVLFAKLVAKPALTRLATPTAAAPALPVSAADLESQLSAAGAAGALPEGPGAGIQAPAGEEAIKALRVWLSER